MLAVHRRESRGGEDLVPRARRHVEDAAQEEHHLAARPGPPCLEEREMARGDLGLEREVELAHAAPLAPLPEELADDARPGPGTRLPARPLHGAKSTPATTGQTLPER